MIFLGALGLGWLVAQSVTFEQRALQEPRTMEVMLMLLGVVAVGVRWSTAALARLDERDLQFEEVPAPAVFELGLQRDGVITAGPPPDRPSNS
jgi:hypothetical protein